MYRIVITALLIGISLLLSAQTQAGFFDFEWKEKEGKIYLSIKADQVDQEFLYVSALAAGVGSNDIGLDRGQLGSEKVVRFVKAGNKILLMQRNLHYRAISDNVAEVNAVAEAFAQSVVWGFPIKDQADAPYKIDLTPFLVRDEHEVAGRLKSRKQGSYKLDTGRSAIWIERTKNFPQNSEFEAILTFTGEATGKFITSVAADPKSISVRQHHSFIQLPDDQYTPRAFHPHAGFNKLQFADYAAPIDQDMNTRWIARHRLEKKNPNAQRSAAVEPIVYYIDSGCPEPVKSALMEGASWWDQAFQAAGYAAGTFSVKELPAGADPLDVRYNMIQWIHRSTRGWSYGSSIQDPRTGEILKGHVSLGSLRVRQDFMIAIGLLSPYDDHNNNDRLAMEMALARLRQLAAHEVGHTIGLAHNFAASTQDRASVMDYPHPLILSAAQSLDFSKAYDNKIGIWDKRAIIYGYSDFSDDVNEQQALMDIIKETKNMGLKFISDQDARPQGGMHPAAHLWDNGEEPIAELDRMMEIRKTALQRFGKSTLQSNTPYSEAEKYVVPLYLMHRYQAEAVTKLIGGVDYEYGVKGQDNKPIIAVAESTQRKAVKSLLKTLTNGSLDIPDDIIKIIAPASFGYSKNRESFASHTGLSFDPMAAAEGYAHDLMTLMLHPQRLARLARNKELYQNNFDLSSYLQLLDIQFKTANTSYEKVVQNAYFMQLLKLSADQKTDFLIKEQVHSSLSKLSRANSYYNHVLENAMSNPKNFQFPKMNNMPPGSPIGCGYVH